jgi:hypothetical protein
MAAPGTAITRPLPPSLGHDPGATRPAGRDGARRMARYPVSPRMRARCAGAPATTGRKGRRLGEPRMSQAALITSARPIARRSCAQRPGAHVKRVVQGRHTRSGFDALQRFDCLQQPADLDSSRQAICNYGGLINRALTARRTVVLKGRDSGGGRNRTLAFRVRWGEDEHA